MSARHPLLGDTIAFVEETEAAARARYVGFAADLHDRLYAARPALRGAFRFFRDPGTRDLWSVCDPGGASFGLQLDPDIEVICLWSHAQAEELGAWWPDPVAKAIERIGETYAPPPARR